MLLEIKEFSIKFSNMIIVLIKKKLSVTMKFTRFLFVIIILLGFLYLDSTSQTEPEYHQQRYISECWLGSDYGINYLSDSQPDSGLYAMVDIGPNEPITGYPMHSGIVKGVSDTITLYVYLRGRKIYPFDITSYDPSNWFVPVVYELTADPRTAHPFADTSSIGYSFIGWLDWQEKMIPQPSSIPSSGYIRNRYDLKYYVWGLPPGRFRLMMKQTDNAPTGFHLLIRHTPGVWITSPMCLADTINAYAACAVRAFFTDDDSAALTWANNILALNPTSIVGYRLKNYAHVEFNDSTNVLATYDSLLAITARYGDPALPDPSKMNPYQNMWYEDVINAVTMAKWMWTTGKRPMFH